MGLTITNRVETVMGDRRAITCDVAFDSSYPTGGEDLTAATLGMTTVDFCISEAKGGRNFVYDRANSKLLAYNVAAVGTHTHTENTAGSYTQNATTAAGGAVSAAALAEVADTTNLSSVTGVRIFAFGK